MKKIIQLTFLVMVLGISLPLVAKINQSSASSAIKTKKALSYVNVVAYNSTSSTGWMYLYNTATDEGTYFTIPANTPGNGTVIGQIPENNDIYNGTVQLNESTPRTIQLYFNYEEDVTYLYGTDMALGCGSCAEVRIN